MGATFLFQEYGSHFIVRELLEKIVEKNSCVVVHSGCSHNEIYEQTNDKKMSVVKIIFLVRLKALTGVFKID